jgi:hypothetical protein
LGFDRSNPDDNHSRNRLGELVAVERTPPSGHFMVPIGHFMVSITECVGLPPEARNLKEVVDAIVNGAMLGSR